MITSTSNARVKRLVNLRKKRKARDEERVFLVEGIRMFREVPVDKLREVYVSESFYKKEKETIEKVLAEGDIRAELVSDTVFSHISDTKTPQGILCVVQQMDHMLEQMLQGEQRHLLVLDNLQDPGNLGTIVRTAEGARGKWNYYERRLCGHLQSQDDSVYDGVGLPYAVLLRRRTSESDKEDQAGGDSYICGTSSWRTRLRSGRLSQFLRIFYWK